MAKLKPAISSNDHSIGKENASVTLVEFGDFECPHCGHAHPLINRLIKEAGDQIQFVFRHFPLQEVHPNAYAAALAAEAAGRQGKFWEMHDLIFEHQQELSTEFFLQLADRLQLDIQKFAQDWQSKASQEKVEGDFESGVRSGVSGTPSFFLNEQILQTYDGSYESLLNAVKENMQS